MIGANREYCTNIHRQKYNFTIHSGQLCAVDTDERGTCYGDDGTPLMAVNDVGTKEIFWYVAGLTSTVSCGKEGVPDISTRVSDYYDWILTKLEE